MANLKALRIIGKNCKHNQQNIYKMHTSWDLDVVQEMAWVYREDSITTQPSLQSWSFLALGYITTSMPDGIWAKILNILGKVCFL